MPFIRTTTTKQINLNQQDSLKTAFGEAIELIPGKTEKWLMLEFRDSAKMAFSGDSKKDCAMVEVEIFGESDSSNLEKLTSKICNILFDILGIEKNRIYVKYRDVKNWGFDGYNF